MWETGTNNIVPAAGPVSYMFLREQTALGSYLSSIKLVFLNGAALRMCGLYRPGVSLCDGEKKVL